MKAIPHEVADRFALYSVSQLHALPEPEWQIDKLFPATSRVVIYGESGSGKSFLALDLALCVATGKEWNGRRVRQGPMIYIAAEGGLSIRKRVDAWLTHHGINAPEAFFLLEAVQVRDDSEVDALLAALSAKGIRPTLIVVDTLARCFVGADENSAKDMGAFIHGIEHLLRSTDATVMILHHSGKAQQRERGSTALRGAADVMIGVTKDEETIILENNKQKDDEEFKDVTLELLQVPAEGVGSDGVTSCVLVPTTKIDSRAKSIRLPRALGPTLRALTQFEEGTAKRAEWLEAVKPRGVETRTLDEHARRLVSGGWVEKRERAYYCITDKGLSAFQTGARGVALQSAAFAEKLQYVRDRNSPHSAASAATPVRVAGAAKAAVVNPASNRTRPRSHYPPKSRELPAPLTASSRTRRSTRTASLRLARKNAR